MPEEYHAPSRWLMLAVTTGVLTLGSMTYFGVAPLGPLIMADLAIGKGQFGLLVTAVALAGLPTTFAAGMLIDRVGVRLPALWTCLCMGVFMLGFFLPQTYLLAYALLLMVGVGYSAITPLTNTAIIDWFPRRERGLALGVKQAGVPLGIALGASFLPTLGLWTSWQVALALTGAVMLVTALVAYTLYREGPLAQRSGGRTAGGQQPPVSPWSLLRNPQMAWLCCIGIFFCIVQNAVVAFMVPFLETAAAMSVVQAGVFLGMSQFAAVVMRPLVGLASDRVFRGRRKEILVLTAILAVLANFLLGLLSAATPVWLVAIAVVFFGVTTLSWAGPFFALAVEQVDPRLVGAASGFAATVLKVGVIVGPPVFGFSVDMTGSYQAVIWGFSGCLALAAFLFFLFFREGVGQPALQSQPSARAETRT